MKLMIMSLMVMIDDDDYDSIVGDEDEDYNVGDDD